MIWSDPEQNWFHPDLLNFPMVNNQLTKVLDKAVDLASSKGDEKTTSCYRSLSHLLLVLYQQLFLQRQPFLALAKDAPMHGLLTSLRAVLEVEPVPALLRLPSTFHLDLVNQLEKSVHFMLGVLSGGKQVGNASFADMGIAVENMVSEQDEEEDIENVNDHVTISDDHSLVRHSCFLKKNYILLFNIKNQLLEKRGFFFAF